MTLKIDVQNLSNPDATNFSVHLLRLLDKADAHNYIKLAHAFPRAAYMLEAWKATPLDKMDTLPDLPYD